MPPEPDHPEHPMDACLKSYSRRRREEAGAASTMPEATRRRLREAVARQYGGATAPAGGPAAASRWAWLKLLWRPPLTYAAGLCLVLGALVWALLELNPRRENLAQAPTQPPPELVPPVTPPPPTSEADKAPARTPSGPFKKLASDGRTTYRERAASESPPTPGAASPSTPQPAAGAGTSQAPTTRALADAVSPSAIGGSEGGAARTKLYFRQTLPPTSPPASSLEATSLTVQRSQPAAPSVTSLAQTSAPSAPAPAPKAQPRPTEEPLALRKTERRGTVVRMEAALAEAPAGVAVNEPVRVTTPVLARFSFEWQDARVWIHDADGSVYEGRWLAAAPDQARKGRAREEAAAAAEPTDLATLGQATNAAQSLLRTFQAVGTNYTLGQRVELTAELVEVPGVPTTFEAKDEATAEKQAVRPWVLQGTVTLGKTNRWPLRAAQDRP